MDSFSISRIFLNLKNYPPRIIIHITDLITRCYKSQRLQRGIYGIFYSPTSFNQCYCPLLHEPNSINIVKKYSSFIVKIHSMEKAYSAGLEGTDQNDAVSYIDKTLSLLLKSVKNMTVASTLHAVYIISATNNRNNLLISSLTRHLCFIFNEVQIKDKYLNPDLLIKGIHGISNLTSIRKVDTSRIELIQKLLRGLSAFLIPPAYQIETIVTVKASLRQMVPNFFTLTMGNCELLFRSCSNMNLIPPCNLVNFFLENMQNLIMNDNQRIMLILLYSGSLRNICSMALSLAKLELFKYSELLLEITCSLFLKCLRTFYRLRTTWKISNRIPLTSLDDESRHHKAPILPNNPVSQLNIENNEMNFMNKTMVRNKTIDDNYYFELWDSSLKGDSIQYSKKSKFPMRSLDYSNLFFSLALFVGLNRFSSYYEYLFSSDPLTEKKNRSKCYLQCSCAKNLIRNRSLIGALKVTKICSSIINFYFTTLNRLWNSSEFNHLHKTNKSSEFSSLRWGGESFIDTENEHNAAFKKEFFGFGANSCFYRDNYSGKSAGMNHYRGPEVQYSHVQNILISLFFLQINIADVLMHISPVFLVPSQTECSLETNFNKNSKLSEEIHGKKGDRETKLLLTNQIETIISLNSLSLLEYYLNYMDKIYRAHESHSSRLEDEIRSTLKIIGTQGKHQVQMSERYRRLFGYTIDIVI